ncbi:MAG: 30S ribosomal protein S17 [Parcubacteria group bacterium]|nr:30S ribosomal protein S17 [Parcubacteria group bacterium]
MPKRLQGTIVSDKQNKTVVVLVNRFVKHPKYKKYVQRGKKYKAHDETNIHKTGEIVTIEECRPISKDKHFKVI